MQLPLIFSEKRSSGKSITVLAGDIGGTKTNLALFSMSGDQLTPLKEASYKSQDFESFTRIADHFLKGATLPEAICIGVAGPVLGGKVKLTNLVWEIDGHEIADHLGVAEVQLINDLEAMAYGLAMLSNKDAKLVHEGMKDASGNAAVIAPGTGLGQAGLFWDGQFYHPFATEGGHCDFAPRNQMDFDLYEFLQYEFGHVSWERLVCGPGIFNIYRFLREVMKLKEPAWLTQKLSEGDAPAVISKNVDNSELCKETMQLFIRYLAFESANLVLKMKATGGLFIGGGIPPQIIRLFGEYQFNQFFLGSGRMNLLLEKVPVKIILNPKAGLLGAAYYGASKASQ